MEIERINVENEILDKLAGKIFLLQDVTHKREVIFQAFLEVYNAPRYQKYFKKSRSLDVESFFKEFLTYVVIEEFLADFGDNRAKFDELLAESALSAEQRGKAQELPHGLKVLVIAEPWSGDVMYNLPPLIHLAEAAGWEMRIFRRDRYPELILPYRKEGLYHSIPVFVFFDQDFNELKRWIERPAVATRTIDEESLKLRRRLREENKDAWRQATIAELFNLAQSG